LRTPRLPLREHGGHLEKSYECGGKKVSLRSRQQHEPVLISDQICHSDSEVVEAIVAFDSGKTGGSGSNYERENRDHDCAARCVEPLPAFAGVALGAASLGRGGRGTRFANSRPG
jgi:hypothetical protein